MGITLHHAIGIEKAQLKAALDRTQAIAEQLRDNQAAQLGISFRIERESDFELRIDIGNCETLSLRFYNYAHYHARAELDTWREGHTNMESYFACDVVRPTESTRKHWQSWPGQELYWSTGFCKTQFADSVVEHRFVAELIRSLASVAKYAHIDDEGHYYHTLKIEDASESIEDLGNRINGLGALLAGGLPAGMTIVKGGSTKIKSRKRK